MAVAKWLKDKIGNIIIPKTKAECVFREDGTKVSDTISDHETRITAIENSGGSSENKYIDWTTVTKPYVVGTFNGKPLYRYAYNEKGTGEFSYYIPRARFVSDTNTETVEEIVNAYIMNGGNSCYMSAHIDGLGEIGVSGNITADVYKRMVIEYTISEIT